jgi:DNA sulfur modification protein DndB
MTEQHLGPVVSGDEIAAELRRRKSKDLNKTVTASTKKLIAEKVKLEEADGWRPVRKNAKSTRMAKPKPTEEQLEDEVWCLLAQIGFKELSKGRHFQMAVEAALPARQVDVFAKDDETVVIVDCTQRDTPGKKSMAHLIEKIRAIREELLKSIRKAYGQRAKLKVKHVIATRNISWSDVDLAKCQEARIAVITDAEIDYYAALVHHLKHAARYQFLAHMFAGQKIDGLGKQVVATRGKMGGEIFYTFLISPDELLKIAYVGHKASRDIENLATYQRMLQPRRLKKIAEYVNSGGKFPTNIVVNLKTGKRSRLQFPEKDKFDNETLGILHLPANYASAWIIDGQHRLYGYAYARAGEGFNQDKTVLPVLAYENLPADKEMTLFIDINSKQVKVSTGLLVELYSDLHWCSSDPEEAFQALLSRIASRLNKERTSPLNDRMVVTGKKKTQYRCLTQTSIRDGLGVAKVLGTFSKGAIVPGPLSTGKEDAYDANLNKGMSVLTDCFRMFANQLENHWKMGDGPGGYVCTNNGIRALLHVIKDVADHIRQRDGTDLCLGPGDAQQPGAQCSTPTGLDCMPLIRGGRAARGTRTGRADPGGLGDDAYMAAVLMAAACYFVMVRPAAAAAARHGFDGDLRRYWRKRGLDRGAGRDYGQACRPPQASHRQHAGGASCSRVANGSVTWPDLVNWRARCWQWADRPISVD